MKGSIALLVLCTCLGEASGSVRQYSNDYAGFLADANNVSSIDFETLPDGSASLAGTQVNSMLNYDAFGAHFSPSNGTLRILGTATAGFYLDAEAPSQFQTTSIIVSLSNPARAIGALFGGGTTMNAYTASNSLIGSVTFNSSGPGLFVGLTSDTPIARAEFTRNADFASIDSFLFAPVPEPATLGLWLFGAAALFRRRRP